MAFLRVQLLAAVAVGALSTAAQAQEAPPAAPAPAAAEESQRLGDIIVTAQRRSENLQNVPIAISAVSSQFLQSRDISSIDRLGSIAPNVKIERAPSNKTISQISIRGSVTAVTSTNWSSRRTGAGCGSCSTGCSTMSAPTSPVTATHSTAALTTPLRHGFGGAARGSTHSRGTAN